MASESSFFTSRGLIVIRRLLVSSLLLALFIIGFWMLNQTLDAVVIFSRDFVDVPFYPLPVDVWFYHDLAYAFLWSGYVGFVVWQMTPWRTGYLTTARVIVALLGFALLTAGLWLAQDTMNAVLALHRTYVDFPFSTARGDIYQSRDVSILLVALGFVAFQALLRVSEPRT